LFCFFLHIRLRPATVSADLSQAVVRFHVASVVAGSSPREEEAAATEAGLLWDSSWHPDAAFFLLEPVLARAQNPSGDSLDQLILKLLFA
jgi:hypothetical protein